MIIVTGFAPFNKEKTNPSWEAVVKIPNQIAGVEIQKIELPVTYQGAFSSLKQILEKSSQCKGVLCVGQAMGRSMITPESIAINRIYGSIADEQGENPFHTPIEKEGPAGYFSTLPVLSLVEALKQNHIPSQLSYHAGTYVCNYVLYSLLHYMEKSQRDLPSGFVHVPMSTDQAIESGSSLPSMPLSLISKGLELCIIEIIKSLS